MKELNIRRLIQASPFEEKLSKEAQEALEDYINEAYECINDVNIDDIIINGISIIDKEEYEEYKDDYFLLAKDDNYYYVLN